MLKLWAELARNKVRMETMLVPVLFHGNSVPSSSLSSTHHRLPKVIAIPVLQEMELIFVAWCCSVGAYLNTEVWKIYFISRFFSHCNLSQPLITWSVHFVI